ncbi:hypothetical protein GCM10009536_19320 [Streptomyces thermocarboxydus]
MAPVRQGRILCPAPDLPGGGPQPTGSARGVAECWVPVHWVPVYEWDGRTVSRAASA